jgi:TolA-binding protein
MRRHFEHGQDLYQLQQYAEAAEAFLEAYRAKPAASLLYNAAISHEKDRRYALAVELFRRYLAESSNPRDRAAVEARIEALTR